MKMGRIKRIHVNRHRVAMNSKDDGSRKTITVKVGKENHYGSMVDVLGPSVVVDAVLCGKKPLSCGARVWIETRYPVCVDGIIIQ